MKVLQVIAFCIVGLYFVIILLIYFLQARFIFHPGRLTNDFKFNTVADSIQEINIKTKDGETLNGLFFASKATDVILYFHGNAGDLSGWQFAAEDIQLSGMNVFLIDYRGYGKSTGRISEQGLYNDAEAAFNYLLQKGFNYDEIIVYGRSIGSCVAVDLASKQRVKGLVLEAPPSSLGDLADEKLPFFFPSIYLRYRFQNRKKINNVRCPIIFIHGTHDSLIPPHHSKALYDKFTGKKELILIQGGQHNDLSESLQFREVIAGIVPTFFNQQ